MIEGEQDRRGDQAACSNCGRGMSPNVRFCTYCGERIESNPGFCPHCGTSIRPGASFCPNCGSTTAVATVRASDRGAIDMAGTEYMGFWIRLAAWIIDLIILSVAQFVVSLISLAFVSFIIGLAYGVLFIGLKGQTPGKMALGIQVVNQQGQIPGIGRAAQREIIGKIVSGVVIFLGFFWIGWDRNKRGWHDHIAGTYVVRKQRNRR